MATLIAERADLPRINKYLHKNFAGFGITARHRVRTNPEVAQFGRESTAPYAQFEPATAQLVQHTDLFERTQRMIKRKQHHQGSETQAPGALGDAR
ncbi:hypothetical protein X744_29160 [Mesorhizobium sp. LNJC372A00]|nr:hypothetical protein X765_30340 [Mesorhizobium sp. LSHC440B00]ESX33577.1 hypothetical protein X764_29685 [Mesorhizobium sp. LSHC440A00]ESY48176.1 hypothetical protein X745_29105 [Mesorhizobium sp. LNJC374B00]ESY52181.1 hypothetical protein X744_29160 [Mesorhizobium sp. LNJC372A00]